MDDAREEAGITGNYKINPLYYSLLGGGSIHGHMGAGGRRGLPSHLKLYTTHLKLRTTHQWNSFRCGG